MNWLEKKILLHELKKYLERASTMKLSWNLVFQAIALAVQYGNQALDIAPVKWKSGIALAIGIMQAIVAWRAHYSNPDGTSAKVAYTPMKCLAFLCIALASVASFAQAPLPSNVYAGGVSFNGTASPRTAGTGLYARLLSADTGTYGFTVYDVLPASVKPFTVTSNVGVGIAQKIFTVGHIPIFAPVSAGISWSGSNTGWQWNGGAMAAIRVKNNWHIYPNVRVVKSSVSSGSGYQPIVGVMVGWQK